MQIELGKTYNLNNGDTVTIDGMVGDDPQSVDKRGYGPFYSNEMGLFHINGRFADGNHHELDIVSEWVTEQVGTIAELGVKAGDVVECVKWSGVSYTEGKKYTVGGLGNGGQVIYNDEDWGKFRIISRADATPKTWGEMTDAEKGALLLAEHEGKVIEISDGDRWLAFDKNSKPNFQRMSRYRIKPEPVVETVALYGKPGLQWVDEKCQCDTHRITFNTIDGEPDCGSVKMEAV